MREGLTAVNLLLEGVVGSRAFGLAGPDSDTDYAGIYVAPTEIFHGFYPPTRAELTVKGRNGDDATYHEVGKAMRLLLSCNPSAMDLLWLDEHLVRTPFGDELIGLRTNFLGAERIRDAYLGYATSQWGKLVRRGQSPGSASDRRREKHARHIARLLEQGYELYRDGRLTVQVRDSERLMEFGTSVRDDPDAVSLKYLLGMFVDLFDTTTPAVPAEADPAPILDLLHRIRRANLDGVAA
ncbi:nucleotidyltransferase domain-containing protein [Nocardia sp. MW-W600-9]